MPYYINYRYQRMPRETVDEFETRKEAREMLKEYRIADPLGEYWLSSRTCKNWKEED